MNSVATQSELSLLALRYAAGELDAVESDDFEQRLATDLDAQMALAQVVQVASAVLVPRVSPAVLVPRVSPATVRPVGPHSAAKPRRGSAWLAVLSSGTVAAAMLVALRQASEPVTPGHTISENSAAGAALSGWAAVELDDATLLASDDAALVVLDEEPPAADDIPDWLFAAIDIGDAVPEAAADSPTADPVDSIDEET